MKVSKVFLSFLLLSLFFIGAVTGQKVWTLNECIKYAHDNNIQLNRKKLQSDLSVLQIKQDKSSLLPDLLFNTTQDFSFARNTDLPTGNTTENHSTSTNFGLNSSITLFNGLYNFHLRKKNEYNLLATIQNIETLTDEIELNILSVYLQILLFEEELEITKNQHKITELQLNDAKLALEAGIIAESDIVELQSQLAYEQYLIVVSENNLNNTKLELLKLLEIKDADIKIQKPDTTTRPDTLLLPDFNEVYNKALHLPYIQSVEYSLKSSQRDIQLVKSQLYPKITLNMALTTLWSDANYLYNTEDVSLAQSGFVGNLSGDPVYYPIYGNKKYSFVNQLKNNLIPAISISATYPIFNRNSNRINRSKTKINITDVEYQLQESKNKLFYELQQLYSDIKAANAEYSSSKAYFKSMQLSFTNAELKFAAGKIASYNYNLAKNKLIKAESDLLKAKYEIIFKMNILNYYRQLPFQL